MKVALLLSGGVDSSVALKLLKDEGHEVTAFYLKIWMEDKFSYLGKCPWEEDLGFAEAVCNFLGVPLEVVPLQKEYWARVVASAIAEVKKGRTPNPDIWCNSRVKFGAFYEFIGDEYERIATGHYARICEVKERLVDSRCPLPLNRGRALVARSIMKKEENATKTVVLKKSPDKVKDQTYFLAHLKQEQLQRAMFPIGKYAKAEVRELARKFNLPTKDRKDSQGICFLGKIKYRDFIREHLGEKKGEIRNLKTDEVMGEHQGYWYYTIGQRKDIKLSGGPWYVVGKDIDKNIIYIGDEYNSESEARDSFRAGELNWISGEAPRKKKLKVKIRHGAMEYRCEVKFIDRRSPLAGDSDGASEGDSDGADKGKGKNIIEVKMKKADKGVAAGQWAVFYDGDVCLGGGVISN